MYGKAIQVLVIILLVIAIAACSEHFVSKLSAKEEVTEKSTNNTELPPIIKVGNLVGCTIVTKYEKTSIIIPWFSKLKILKVSGNWIYVQRGAETAYKYWMYVPNYIWVEEKGT